MTVVTNMPTQTWNVEKGKVDYLSGMEKVTVDDAHAMTCKSPWTKG